MERDAIEWAPSTNVFLNYLPKHWTKQDLVELCIPFGRIESAKVIIDLKTGNSKCYGFVRYSTLDSAVTAVLRLNGFATSGKRLLARFARGQENTGTPTKTIRVKSLPITLTDREVWQLYQQYGEIVHIEFEVDPNTKKTRRSAIVTFRFQESAIEAVRQTNNLSIGSDWPLFVQYVQSVPIVISAPLKI
jgi:RNA recognition motif-containing protein